MIALVCIAGANIVRQLILPNSVMRVHAIYKKELLCLSSAPCDRDSPSLITANRFGACRLPVKPDAGADRTTFPLFPLELRRHLQQTPEVD
jgi:hypothetical protein